MNAPKLSGFWACLTAITTYLIDPCQPAECRYHREFNQFLAVVGSNTYSVMDQQLTRARVNNYLIHEIQVSHLPITHFQELHQEGIRMFRGIQLPKTNLEQLILNHTSLDCANLKGASLHGTSLVESSLDWAELQEANLSNANLTKVHMTGANLNGANLARATLNGANLQQVNLTGANLAGASLMGANLEVANLKDADLTNADLTGANLQSARFNSRTILPEGTDRSTMVDADRFEVRLEPANQP